MTTGDESAAGGDGFTREVIGVAAGYMAIPLLTMVVTVIVTRFVEPTAILLRPDDVEPTRGWLVFSVGLGAAVALSGGLLCGAIARTRRASFLLAAVVLTMGLVLAIPILRAAGAEPAAGRQAKSAPLEPSAASPLEPPDRPAPAVAAFRAALAVRSPTRWLVWKPVISALLVLLGARIGRLRP